MPARPGGVGGGMPSRPGGAMGGGGMPSRGGSMGNPGGMGSRGGMSGGMGGSMGAGLGSRRDVTEKKEKPIYYSQLNFDETSNDYMMTKVTIGTLVVLTILTVLAVFLNWGINAFIGLGIAYLFWGFYFFSSLVMKPKMARMPYKDKKNYWTYELTNEYKDRNVVLNDFKRNIGTVLIKPNDKVLIDDVSVELMSYDPLIFDFAIRSRIKKEEIMRAVPTWSGQFDCETGTITNTGINQYRVVYPRKDKWETLAGKSVSPNDVVGEHHDPTLSKNPIGIRTDTFEEVYMSNADEHTVITGESGYGKSNTFNLILKNLFPTNALILFFDAKKMEAPAVNDRCFSVIEYEQANAWRQAIMEEMDRRAQYITKQGKAKLLPPAEADLDPDALPFTNDMPPIVLAIDECGMWVSNTMHAQDAKKFKDFINEVSRLGRAAGITLICGSQSPRDTDIPDLVKRNASQYIAYRQSSETENRALGKDKVPDNEARPSQIPLKAPHGGGGVGQFAFSSSATDNKAIPVKAYYASKEEVIKSSHENKNKKKSNLKVVQRASSLYEKEKQKSTNPGALPISLEDPTVPDRLD